MYVMVSDQGVGPHLCITRNAHVYTRYANNSMYTSLIQHFQANTRSFDARKFVLILIPGLICNFHAFTLYINIRMLDARKVSV